MGMDLFTSTLQALNGHCVSGYNSSGSKAPLRRKVRKTSRRKRKRRRYGYSCRASGNEKYSNNYNNNNNNNRSNSNSNSNSNNHNNNRKNVNMQSSQCHTVKYNDNDNDDNNDNNDHDDVVVAAFAKNNDNDDHDDVDVDNKCKIVVNNVRKMPRMHSINNKQHNMNINYNNKSSNQRNDISKSNRKSNNHDSNGNNGSYCLGARDSKKMTTLLTSPITVTKNTTALPTALPTTALKTSTTTAIATGRVIRPPTKIEQVQLCQNKRRKTRRREIGSEADAKEPKCLYSREKYTAAAAATTTTIAATSATMVERKFKSATFHSHLAAMATPRKTAKGLSSTPCTFVWRHRHCWFSIRWPHTLHKSYAVIFMAMLVFSICHKSVLNAMAVQIPKGNSTDEVDTGKSPITFTVQLNEYPPNKQHDVHSQQQVQMKPQMEGQLQTPSQLSESHNNEIYQKEEEEEETRRETEIPQQEKQQQMQSFSTEFIFNSGMSLGTNNNHTFQSLSIIDGGGLMADTSQSLLSQMTSFDNDDFTYPLTKDAMPIFDFGMPRNITARTGHTEAVIRCRVDRLDDKSVSWIRKRDLHILTVGTATYTSDKRFQVTESKDSREWTLHVKSPQARDSGIYECQVNTEPKISMAFQLNVIEISPDAKAVITGPADLHFKVGSAIILTCIVYQPSVKDIGPIYWYRGEYMITPFDINDLENEIAQPTSPSNIGRAIEDNVKPGTPSHAAHKTDSLEGYSEGEQLPNEITQDFTQRIAMESQLGDTMKSRLRISNAQASDTGNYTCQPTTASSASVMVHVINDENPAAMQKSRGEGLKSMTMTTAIVIGLANVSSKLLVLMLTTAFSFNTLLKFLCHEN
ncbi:uncharacterized protein ACN2A1_000164 [Glossina fuscipes fuscipes]